MFQSGCLEFNLSSMEHLIFSLKHAPPPYTKSSSSKQVLLCQLFMTKHDIFFFSFSKHPPPIYYSLWMPSFTSSILFLHSISLPLPQAKPSRHEVDPNNSFLSERPPSSPLCLFPWFYVPPACQFGNTTSRRSIFQCHLSLLQAVSGVLPDVCQLVKPLKLVLLEEETSTEFHEEKTAHVRTGTGKGETCR